MDFNNRHKDLKEVARSANHNIKPRGILKSSCSTEESDLSFSGVSKPLEGSSELKMKKSVKFNSHVSCNFFRSNSSILGQKKKNQRKGRKKKKSCSLTGYQCCDHGNGVSLPMGDSEESSASEPDSLASSPTTDALLPFYNSKCLVPVNNLSNCFTFPENVLTSFNFSSEEIHNAAGMCENGDLDGEIGDVSLVFEEDLFAGIKECGFSSETLSNRLMFLTLDESDWSKRLNSNFCLINWLKDEEDGPIRLFGENKGNLICSEGEHKHIAVTDTNTEEDDHVTWTKSDALDIDSSEKIDSNVIKMLAYPSNLHNVKIDKWNNNNVNNFDKLDTSDDENLS